MEGEKKNQPGLCELQLCCSYCYQNSALILQTKQETKKRIAPASPLAMQVHLEFHAEQQFGEICLFHEKMPTS